MVYTAQYISPLGAITIACDDEAIIGLWFNDQCHFAAGLPDEAVARTHPLLVEAARWLDIYFAGQEPDFLPPLRCSTTAFRQRVCDIMLTIPYGKTITYGEIANQLAKDMGINKMSAQAVGGAVGHNPISIMIPCHRVVGAKGNLTGYGGGLDRKIKLLELEKVDMARFLPQKCRKGEEYFLTAYNPRDFLNKISKKSCNNGTIKALYRKRR